MLGEVLEEVVLVGRLVVVVLEGVADAGRVEVAGVVTVLDMVAGLLLDVLVVEVLTVGLETLVDVFVLVIVEVDAGLLLTEELTFG